MKSKIFLGLSIMILLVYNASAFEITEFTNALSAENLTFNGTQNITRYLQVPRYIDFSSGLINLTSIVGNEQILEELVPLNWTAEATTTSIFANKALMFDGLFSTVSNMGITFLNDGFIYSYENYTINNSYEYTVRHKGEYSITGTGAQNSYIEFNMSCEDENKKRYTINYTNITHPGDSSTYAFEFNATVPIQCTENTSSLIFNTSVYFQNNNPESGTYGWYETGIHTFNNSYNPYVNTGDNNIISISNRFNTTSGNITTTQLNVIRDNDCGCTGCIKTSEVCNIPYIFHSDTLSTLEYSNLSVEYSYALYDINVTIYDSVTLKLLNNTNITAQYIGSELQFEKTTTNGFVNFEVNISTISEDVSLILFETSGTDYSLAAREFTYYQGTPQNISIYMTNTSVADLNKEVTFIVKDEDKVLLEGAVIKIFKRDPATNQFLQLTDLTTNPDGEATTVLTLDTVFYKFIVIYNGVQVYVSSAAYPISSSDDTITLNCIVGESYSDYYLKTQGFEGILQFTKITNESGYYTITYTSVNSVTACLNTSYITNTVTIQNGETCLTGTSGVLTSNTITVSSFSDVFAYLSIDFGGTEGKQVVRSLHNYLGLSNTTSDTGRLFVLFGLIILSSVVFIYVPIIGLVVFAVGILSVSFTKFTLIDIPFAMFIVGLVIFVIFALNKNDKK